jgi:hypothetical protein
MAGCDALDGAAAHVAGGKYARPACLQKEWCQVLVLQLDGRNIAASQEEAVLVLSAELPLPTIATGPLRQAWASAYVAA